MSNWTDQTYVSALRVEVEMLNGMIEEVEGQRAQIEENLFKLKAVRCALSEVIDQHPELDLKEEEE